MSFEWNEKVDEFIKEIRNNRCKESREYLDYILEHKNLVVRAYNEIKPHIEGGGGYWLDDYSYYELKLAVKNHDMSKFDSLEFNGYRNYFYPKDGVEKRKSEFLYSWNHHQKNNKHHWEYWVTLDGGKQVTIPMPWIYVVEMLLDWKAMSYKFGDTVQDFYKKNKKKMILHKDTVESIDYWIKIF